MDTKEQILEAAIECFTRFGYGKTTMSDIGKKVGMNKASLYYHYKDKEALYHAVISKLRREHNLVLRNELHKISPYDKKIIAFIKAEVNFTKSIAMNYFSDLADNEVQAGETSAAYKPIIRESIESIAAIIDEGINDRFFKNCDSMHIAEMILNVGRGFLLANCPLNKPLAERESAYDQVKLEISEAVQLILTGLMNTK